MLHTPDITPALYSVAQIQISTQTPITLTEYFSDISLTTQTNTGIAKLTLCLIKNYDMKAYAVVEVYLHVFLTSVVHVCKWSASCPTSFTSRERAPDTRCIRGWVGSTATLDAVEKIKSLAPTKNWTLMCCSHYTDSAITEGRGHGLISRTIPKSACKDWEKP
jgi:hypothetical protein